MAYARRRRRSCHRDLTSARAHTAVGKGFANANDATTNMLAEIFEAVWGALFLDSGNSYPRESPTHHFWQFPAATMHIQWLYWIIVMTWR